MVQLQENLNLALEPSQLYHSDKLIIPARFALCWKYNDLGKLKQELFDIQQLDTVVRQVEKMTDRHKKHFWISQATLAPGARNRRISSIVLLNAIWVDIDLAHPPKGFDSSTLPSGGCTRNAEHLAALLAIQIEDAGLPAPTYIIATGGGLCAKWVFEQSISSEARPRWQSLQKYIVKCIGELVGDFGARWPVDKNACDAARILRLVGTHNPRWDAPCRIVWDGGQQHDFNYLADEILPYSRNEVAAFRAKAREWNVWSDNRLKASAAGICRAKSGVKTNVDSLIEDEAARVLWTNRFEFGRRILDARGGAGEGHRNDYFWPLANALAWSCSSADQLIHELAALHHGYFQTAGWTRSEAIRSAGSVLGRMGKDDLYRMRTKTFLEKMNVTPSELSEYGKLLGGSNHNKMRDEWNLGVMGFEPMKGLSSEAFITETKRRQALSGARSAEVRNTTHNLELRTKAILMRSNGLSYRAIARALEVDDKTVSSWVNST